MEKIAARLEEIFKPLLDKFCGKAESCDRCCRDCVSMNAYFTFGDSYFHKLNAEGLQQVKAVQARFGWDVAKGFLGETGCRLPRSERSAYCQEMACRWIKPNMTIAEQVEVKDLTRELKRIRAGQGSIQ